jgi:hypothetical protein
MWSKWLRQSATNDGGAIVCSVIREAVSICADAQVDAEGRTGTKRLN